MIVSEIELKTPEEWLETVIELGDQIKIMKMTKRNNWRIDSGMTKTGWYIRVLADEKGKKDV